MTAPPTLNVGLLLYPEVEVLDFAGPYEVFTTASRMALRQASGASEASDVPNPPPPFAVCTLARGPGAGGLVKARAGLQVQADHGLAHHPPLQLLLVPGGVVKAELQCADTLAWLRRQADSVPVIGSVCTGAFLLAAAGLLPDGMAVTTHWEDADDLRAAHPGLDVQPGRRYIDHGTRITSAGISAGIDMALHLVARLHSPALAERTARQLDVVWTREA